MVRTNQQLIAAFLPPPPLPSDVGLSALQAMGDGEIYFSVQTKFFSGKLGRVVQPGDLLTDLGAIVKANADLLRLFGPTNNCGLDSVHVWPSGEIWFSTQNGFYDSSSNYYGPGDLLSDQGYVVYRNSELLASFQPAESVADLGLDALFIVTDVIPATPAVKLGLPQLTNQPPASLTLLRSGGSRAFQLERATNVAGPYVPVSPIATDTLFLDAGVLTNQPQSFYRLQQW